jgi:hypothetical protein
MTSVAPNQDPMIEESGRPKQSWAQFFSNLSRGDGGEKFTPTYIGLTTSGTPTVLGFFYENSGFIDFYITITPGTSTGSTLGSTYFDLPFAFAFDTPCYAVGGGGSAIGYIEASTKRCYTPSWSGATYPITINGRVKL